MKLNRLALTDRQTGKIDSLQALRALAFLGIFLGHASFYIEWALLSVSVFFVMSGFLMTYKYEHVELGTSLKANIEFTLKKIIKLYPLHILTMLFAITLNAALIFHNGIGVKSVIALIGETFLNLTLLQAWVPYSSINFSLNGVAWYLSVTMFLYFTFPWLKRIIEKESIRRLCIMCGAILIIEILSCIPFIMVLENDSPVYIWFMYCFPLFRLGDFFIGCVLKRVYFEGDFGKLGNVKGTIQEIIATAITVLVFLWMTIEQRSLLLLSLQNYTTAYIPLAAIWIILFIEKRGLITKVLSNSCFIFIGSISAYAFLIHYVVTTYTAGLLTWFELNIVGWGRILLILLELIVSLLLSVLYKWIHEKYEYTLKKNRLFTGD